MRAFTILLDQDEVLTDFVSAACQIHGTTRALMLPNWPHEQWSIVEPLAKTLSRPLSNTQFWAPIHNNEQFWLDLLPTPWCDQLWQLCRSHSSEVHIVSSPAMCDTSYTGKVKWLKKKFGQSFDNFILSPHKHLLAKPSAVLIDDRDENCRKFVRAGGKAILFPSHGNRLYSLAHDPLSHVQQVLEELCISK